MESFNKVLSFVLGLVVVIVFLAIVSGKIDLRRRLTGTSSSTTGFSLFGRVPSPTPTVQPTPSTYGLYEKTGRPQEIPATGLPTFVLPLLFSGLTGGLILRKKN